MSSYCLVVLHVDGENQSIFRYENKEKAESGYQSARSFMSNKDTESVPILFALNETKASFNKSTVHGVILKLFDDLELTTKGSWVQN